MAFLAPLAGPLIGAGAALIGGSMSASATSDAAAQAANAAAFRPYDVGGSGLGLVDFDQSTLSVNATGDPINESIRSLLGLQSIGALTSNNNNFLQNLQSQGLGQLGGLFNQSQLANQQSVQAAQASLGQLAGGTTTRAYQGNQLTQMLQQLAQGQGRTDQIGNYAAQQGAGLLGQASSIPGVVDQTLSTLRAQARPAEERAVNSRIQDLFSRGTLSSTSGARAIGELGLAQEQADISRQIAAQQVGMQQFGQIQNAGQGLLFGGANQMLQGQQGQQTLASILGQQGFQNLSAQAQAGQGLFNAQQGVAALGASRAQERMGNAQSLFGFGQQGLQGQQAQAISGLNAGLAVNADLRNLIALGGNIGGQQASAGANQASAIMSGAGSGIGAGLTGLGTGLFNSAVSNLFPTTANTPQ